MSKALDRTETMSTTKNKYWSRQIKSVCICCNMEIGETVLEQFYLPPPAGTSVDLLLWHQLSTMSKPRYRLRAERTDQPSLPPSARDTTDHTLNPPIFSTWFSNTFLDKNSTIFSVTAVMGSGRIWLYQVTLSVWIVLKMNSQHWMPIFLPINPHPNPIRLFRWIFNPPLRAVRSGLPKIRQHSSLQMNCRVHCPMCLMCRQANCQMHS